MRSKSALWIWLLIGVAGCTQTIDLAPPAFVREPVVAALLQPDSLIRVRLSYSFPANALAPTPEPIRNARVILTENGTSLPPLVEEQPGLYVLNSRPKAGHTYALTAVTPDGATLTAQDRMPVRPTLSARLTSPNPNNFNSAPDVVLTLSPFESTSAVQWISAYQRRYRPNPGATGSFATSTVGLQSNSLLLDAFNSNLSGRNFKRFYWPYARIRPLAVETLDDPSLTVETRLSSNDVSKPGEFYKLTIWTGSLAFDQYLRSVITAYQNRLSSDEGISDNPFAQPTPIVGNITNGKGIFAAYATQVIVLKEVK